MPDLCDLAKVGAILNGKTSDSLEDENYLGCVPLKQVENPVSQLENRWM